MRLVPIAAGLGLVAACSPVQKTTLRPDYAEADRTQTVRLAIVVAPLPAGDQDVADLWSMMARSYVNQHRDFIVSVDRALPAVPADACAEHIEGVLLLAPFMARDGDGVQASVSAKLVRCRDHATVWTAESAGSWSTDDSDLTEARKHWVQQTSAAVDPYVVATFRLLTATLETLPTPAFPDATYVHVKIDLGE